MKNKLLIIALCIVNCCFSQTPNWQWGNNNDCFADDKANVVTHDKHGNVYVAGVFRGVITLDTSILVSKGENDIFIVKYSSTGQILWARCGGSFAQETINALTTDSSGNVYITGSIGGHVTYPVIYYDTAYFSESSIISKSNMDVFLVSYSPAGTIRWLKDFGSEYDDIGTALLCNKNNNIILGGEFSQYGGSPPIHGTITFDNYFLTSNGNSDIFICSLDESGNVLWAENFGKSNDEYLKDIDVDTNNNIYFTALFDNSINLGGILINSVSSGFVIGDCLIAKLNSNGTALWAKAIGGGSGWSSSGGSVVTSKISVAQNGNVYVLGNFGHCSLIFQGGTFAPNEIIDHIFLSKYDDIGNLKWVKVMGGSNDFNEGNGLYLDKDENSYITGYFTYTDGFGKDTLHGYGNEDVFVTQYNKDGNEQWAVNLGGTGSDVGYGIDGDNSGNLYLAGSFTSDYFKYQSQSIVNTGGSDMFLVKLSQTTGIENTPEAIYASIYPNPANENLIIKSKESIAGVSLYDMTGRLVAKLAFQNPLQETSIPTRVLANGLYFLQLTSKNGASITQKVVVEH